jgi:hypothetical protein
LGLKRHPITFICQTVHPLESFTLGRTIYWLIGKKEKGNTVSENYFCEIAMRNIKSQIHWVFGSKIAAIILGIMPPLRGWLGWALQYGYIKPCHPFGVGVAIGFRSLYNHATPSGFSIPSVVFMH